MRRALLLVLPPLAALAGEPVLGTGEAAAQSAAQLEQPPTSGETTVQAPRGWSESDRSGPYNQPKWTERRRFPGTRIYVAPPGSASFELWLENKTPIGGNNRLRTLYELAFGLGYRLQLDLYARTQNDGEGPLRLESARIELRWALADWGVIPGNPTVYLEWIIPTKGPMKAEVKVLLGGELTPRLYWGANLFFERELGGTDLANEYGFTGGISYALVDSKFSLGAEVRLELVDTRDRRFSPDEIELLLGPTIAFKPIPQASVLLVWFLGPGLERTPGADYTTTLVMQPTLVAGWKF